LHIGKLVWSEVSFNNSGMNREVHVPLCERLAGRLRRSTRLFMGNERGGIAASVFFSLIESAKANDLNTYAYLRLLMSELPLIDQTNQEELIALLPHKIGKSRLAEYL